MAGSWWLPLAIAVWLGLALVAGAWRRRGAPASAHPDRALAELLAAEQVSSLRARLHEEPSVVRSARATSLYNRLVLDLGDVELDARCYRPATASISRVLGIFYVASVGWVIDADGPAGPTRVVAWLLQVRPLRR